MMTEAQATTDGRLASAAIHQAQHSFDGVATVKGRPRASHMCGEASAIQTNETLFRVGFAAGLLAVAFDLAYRVLFYDLFRPVSRSIALLAASVSIAACALQAFASLFQLGALLVVGGWSGFSGFTSGQAQDLAQLLLKLIWLLVMGVNERRWPEHAQEAGVFPRQ